MGLFGAYLYDGVRWVECEPGQEKDAPEPWLMVNIHDSDIATVVYRPAGPGSGVAYLGHTPRTYFEDPEASAPTDVEREAAGLGFWWSRLHGGADELGRAAKERELLAYLAEDLDPEEIEWDEEEDVDQLDDAEILVEVKAARFLGALGLPVPDSFAW